jgi:hypothetical protein
MKYILSLIISGALVVSGFGQTRNVLVGTNNAVVQPTNFWSADSSNARSGLGLGTAATNPATAFQPSSLVLSNLALSNGFNLTNISVSGVVGALATNGNATNLTNFPANLLRTNGNAAGLTNFPASLLTTNGNGAGLTNLTAANITGTVALASNLSSPLALTNGGTGATNAATARTNLGLGNVGQFAFDGTNNAVYVLTNFVVTNNNAYFGVSQVYHAFFGSTNTGFANNLGGVGYFHNGSNIWYVNTNGLEFNSPSVVRSNLGLSLAALTNTNASNFRTAIGATAIGHSLFTATNSAAAIDAIGISTNFADQVLSVSNIFVSSFPSSAGFVVPTSGKNLTVAGTNVSTAVPAFFGWNGFSGAAFSAAESRTNLGLNAWTTNTNSPVFVGTNGEVVSPTNFWQVAPIVTRFVEFDPPTNATTNIVAARNLHIHSLAISRTGVTSTIALPTNGAFNGDIALVAHKGPTSSVTAVRTAGATNNLVTMNQPEEAVEFVYYNSVWQFNHNLSYIEPIFFSGTNAAANAAASRTNLGLGATWLTNTNVTNFRNAIELGATNSVSFDEIVVGGSGDVRIQGSANEIRFWNDQESEDVLVIPAGPNSVEINSQWNNTNVRSNLGLGTTDNVSFSNVTASGTLTATGAITATTNLVVNGFVDFSTNHTNSNPATNNQIQKFLQIRIGTNAFFLPLYR